MQIGIDSFVTAWRDPALGPAPDPATCIANLLNEVEAADRAGLHSFGIGEHHRMEFLDSAPTVLLGAAAARTRSIRLNSAVTVLAAADPVRVHQDFATLDLISRGRAEIVVGRGSFAEAHPLFGVDFEDYDAAFAEKLDLLLRLREQPNVTWEGRFRPRLTGQGVFPRPHQARLPVWLGVGGTPASFVRAGTLGLPLMIAIIGGSFARFRPLVDLYREAGHRAGHRPETLKVGIHALGFLADTDKAARETFYPGWLSSFSRIGRERGWQPPTRAQFDAQCAPGGAFLVASPGGVASRLRQLDVTLGGIDRVTFQMSSVQLDHPAMLRSIELLGTVADGRTTKAAEASLA